MGHPRNMEDSVSEGDLNHGGPAQDISEGVEAQMQYFRNMTLLSHKILGAQNSFYLLDVG